RCGVLEGRLQGGHDAGIERFRRLEQETIAAVLHIGNDAPGACRLRILVVILHVLLVPGPVAALDVEDEAVLLLITATRPPQVYPPESGGVPVGQGRYGRTVER